MLTLRRTLHLVVILSAIYFVLPLTTIPLALSQMNDLAGGRPYCVDVARYPERWGYRPARTVLDLRAS